MPLVRSLQLDPCCDFRVRPHDAVAARMRAHRDASEGSHVWHFTTVHNPAIEHMFYSLMMRRHVWCDLRHQQPPWPGLLLEWRKVAGSEWEGLVLVLTKSSAHTDFDSTSTVLVPATKLRPVERDRA
jgi:hypothetical protein